MRTFDEDLRFLREFLERGEREGRVRRLTPSDPSCFQVEEPQLVLKEEAWVELGNPELPSFASVLLTETPGLVREGGISLIGEDLPALRGEVPFAQLCLVESREVRDEDYRRLSLAPFRLKLRGYMVRSLPSQLRIWSRVSAEAVEGGFSFSLLGEALRRTIRTAFPVSSVEVVFSTSEEGVRALWGLGEKAGKIAGAIGKMVEEVSLDCERCEYREICGTVAELREIRERKLREGRG